jgi:UDP-N-acetylmuramyl tripeptide synthase
MSRSLNLIKFWVLILVGKLIILGLKLSGKGGGSALPGLVVEKIYPSFLNYGLNHLKFKPLVITGTNGKTTTTKLVAEIFKSQKFRVLTNPSGSNFTRGIASELIKDVKFKPLSRQFDIAVLELDEAYAKQFANKVDIGSLLILNISRDQLDRFGEIDATHKLLESVAQKADKLVLNLNEGTTADFYKKFSSGDLEPKQINFFGAEPKLAEKMSTKDSRQAKLKLPSGADLVTLQKAEASEGLNLQISLKIVDEKLELKTELQGIYNALNFAAALAAARSVIGKKLKLSLVKKSEKLFKPAWGRSQQFVVGGASVHLILVKNPSGFNHAVNEFGVGESALFALNDDYADGRDVSWIWDVQFGKLSFGHFSTCGSRAYDMALRLKYDDLNISAKDVQPKISEALNLFLNSDSASNGSKTIFASYTAMVEIYKILNKLSPNKSAGDDV